MLKKVRPEEVKLRKALLQDLQAQVKQAHLKVLGKHIGALRGAVKSDGPSDVDAVVDAGSPTVKVEDGGEPEKGPSEPTDADFSPETEQDEVAESEPKKGSLSDMIRSLRGGKK